MAAGAAAGRIPEDAEGRLAATTERRRWCVFEGMAAAVAVGSGREILVAGILEISSDWKCQSGPLLLLLLQRRQ
jgi:hypothetical protein